MGGVVGDRVGEAAGTQNTRDKRGGTGVDTRQRRRESLEYELGEVEGRGAKGVKGQASYFERVLSAKCFCWLSACLPKTTTPLEE